jgi:hypothetical protein
VTGDAGWAIEFEPRAEKDLARVDQPVARRVIAALNRKNQKPRICGAFVGSG